MTRTVEWLRYGAASSGPTVIALVLVALLGGAPTEAQQGFLRYQQPSLFENPLDCQWSSYILTDAAVRQLNIQLQSHVSLRNPVDVRLVDGECRDGYVPAENYIQLCHKTFLLVAREVTPIILARSAQSDKLEAGFERLVDNLYSIWVFVLAHEVAHGLVHAASVVLVGDEESSVDQFAAVMLLETSQGSSGVRGGVELMNWRGDYEDQERAVKSKHGWSRQRAERLQCIAAGQDAQTRLADRQPSSERALAFARHMIRRRWGFDEERFDRCVAEYPVLVDRWKRLLAGVWKP